MIILMLLAERYFLRAKQTPHENPHSQADADASATPRFLFASFR